MSNVVKRVKIGKEVSSDHPIYRLLKDQQLIHKTIREGGKLSDLKDKGINFVQPL